ncbi:unnamed protein product [Cercopithifilaria johnstoni]|uniref:Uncharacterized protein n=1 Tax=Cercopithifilaria johnstoni TaxID=2874296 RepID=A0A8J2LN67_9BILA|nr:unnamed protein product [Cercopithifilaria johnstoni]
MEQHPFYIPTIIALPTLPNSSSDITFESTTLYYSVAPISYTINVTSSNPYRDGIVNEANVSRERLYPLSTDICLNQNESSNNDKEFNDGNLWKNCRSTEMLKYSLNNTNDSQTNIAPQQSLLSSNLRSNVVLQLLPLSSTMQANTTIQPLPSSSTLQANCAVQRLPLSSNQQLNPLQPLPLSSTIQANTMIQLLPSSSTPQTNRAVSSSQQLKVTSQPLPLSSTIQANTMIQLLPSSSTPQTNRAVSSSQQLKVTLQPTPLSSTMQANTMIQLLPSSSTPQTNRAVSSNQQLKVTLQPTSLSSAMQADVTTLQLPLCSSPQVNVALLQLPTSSNLQTNIATQSFSLPSTKFLQATDEFQQNSPLIKKIRLLHDQATHHARLAQDAWEEARAIAVSLNMPPPSLPDAVDFMTHNYLKYQKQWNLVKNADEQENVKPGLSKIVKVENSTSSLLGHQSISKRIKPPSSTANSTSDSNFNKLPSKMSRMEKNVCKYVSTEFTTNMTSEMIDQQLPTTSLQSS